MRITKKVIAAQGGDSVGGHHRLGDAHDRAATTAPPTLPRPPSTTIDSSSEIRS